MPDITKLYLRAMQAEDLPAVLAIEQAAFVFPWSDQQLREAIQAGNHCQVLMLQSQQPQQQHHSHHQQLHYQQQHQPQPQLIGYGISLLVLDEAHLLNMAIAPAWQQQGYGHWLLSHLLAEFQTLDIQRVLLEVRQSNIAALQLYQQLGFQPYNIRKNYYTAAHGREDAILMHLLF